ncbi:lysophospholipase D GDPD1 [Octopus bimaculoides]|uniref:GP-PDE domain-containing protein n=1 Tax=Octopus bimaculoides TaxID=37653 RepID=A0A0L8FSF1_OCTBM|nr:lysophospholipase D GDPD1 [Octopus bimaculoides]|eukprot:XP_014787325.1 PREDICTED: glycerophosphodiester phosphodiesterase domain-containing protein 1-like isoform X1 [Octopus bimaculoides]
MVFGLIVGGYVFTSLLLLKYPNLLHKKKRIKFTARHISHRGGAGEHLENTMTAFRHATNTGTEMLELDCHLTKDNQVVVCHDNNLLRTCGCAVLISQTDYKDLPPMKNELPLDFNPNVSTVGVKDRHIPLLKEVFDDFPSLPINIDVKVNDDVLIQKVSDLVKEYNREQITVWGNRQETINGKCFKCNPRIPLVFSFRRVLILLALFYSGLLPFVPIKESFLEVIMPSIILDEKKSLLQFSKNKRLLIQFCDIILMRPLLFEHLEKRGIQVYLWVLNDDDEFAKGFKHGATGIMTDYPTKLGDFIEKNPHFFKR